MYYLPLFQAKNLIRYRANIRIQAVLASFLFVFSSNSFSSELSDMLKRISEADQNQNYQGIFILRKSDKLSTLRVTHAMDEKNVWETLEALDGESRKILRLNNSVISIFPERELVTIRHTNEKQSLHPQLPENIDKLEMLYTINRLDDGRIANHPTLVVNLSPKDQFRYGYRYWVDRDTGMLLRCDLVADDEQVIEQMMFTSLDYLDDAPKKTFDIQQFAQFEQEDLDEPELDVSKTIQQEWTVNKPPKGFMLTQSTMRYSQLSDAQGDRRNNPDLLHMVYSDGLASVSVFVEKNKGTNQHLQGRSSMGAVNAFGSAKNDFFVTAVGEVPIKTVQSMAQSTVKLR
ncbi:MAG TPA: hypothetical protein ENJ87_05195 [Gammaproteobacteria bacterium]|nr:hypothetical protein [Gammaproteobacteria bacterium]